METLNFRVLVDLWESWDNRGKLHVGYNVCVDTSTLSIYGAQGREECIIVSLETIFFSYHKWVLYSLTPMLWNFILAVGKTYFWPITQLTTKLEHIGNETINNLISRRVVCLNAVRNVGKARKHQNDQVSTQELPAFLRGEYNESNEFLGANENNVAN
jgi:hypothetical protein